MDAECPRNGLLSVNVPLEVKAGLITKPNVFQSVRASAASDHRIPPQNLSAFLGTQLSDTGRHGSCTDACVDRFEV